MTTFLLAAVTADGFIGRTAQTRSFDWTSAEDKQFYVSSIKRARAVIMGAKTFQTFTKYPRGLKFVVYTSQPEGFINPKPDVITLLATKDDPAKILADLEKEGFDEVAICGGASIYSMFLKAGLVNKLYLTVEPVFFGQGVKLFSEEVNVKLKLVKSEKLSDQTMLLEYDVVK